MTNLSRRRFFGLLGGTAATYFLPPIGGWKSDVIINPIEDYQKVLSVETIIPGEVFFFLPSNPGVFYSTKGWNGEPLTFKA